MTRQVPRRGWYHGWNIVGVCIAAQMAGMALTMNCFSLFLPDWTREFEVPVSTIALGITLFSLAVVASSYLIGVCVDRYPIRRLFGGAVVVGLSGAVWTLLASSILAEFGPASFGRAFGLACALSPIGTFAPPLVARVQEMTGSYATPLATVAALCLTAALGVLLLFRKQGAPLVAQPA